MSSRVSRAPPNTPVNGYQPPAPPVLDFALPPIHPLALVTDAIQKHLAKELYTHAKKLWDAACKDCDCKDPDSVDMAVQTFALELAACLPKFFDTTQQAVFFEHEYAEFGDVLGPLLVPYARLDIE